MIAIANEKSDRDRKMKIASSQPDEIYYGGYDASQKRVDPNGAHFRFRLTVFPDRLATIHQKGATCFSESLILASESLSDG
ncbi:MAG TPA: hypothetical protein VLL74_01480 [Methanoregula sp.]|nr:hypothetical protein [Methanoregula sp.]